MSGARFLLTCKKSASIKNAMQVKFPADFSKKSGIFETCNSAIVLASVLLENCGFGQHEKLEFFILPQQQLCNSKQTNFYCLVTQVCFYV